MAQPGLPQQAQHWVRARLVSRARTAWCEDLPRVTGLSPGLDISAQSLLQGHRAGQAMDPTQHQQSPGCRAVPRVYMEQESLWFSAGFEDADLLRMM